MRRVILVLALALAGAIAVPGAALAAGAGGVGGPAFYVDGELYRTVGTPTDLSGTGAPADSFDVIYQFAGAQPFNVAEAAPGDTDYNGGRWRVHLLSFASGYAAALAANDLNGNGVFDSDAEIDAALADGSAVDNGVVRQFVCPVIELTS
ncbi:MAG: hypothetical protein ACRDH0_05915 [Actinomycetota bacterium]